MSGAITRAEVWKTLGAPADQIGSVNEPRAVVEQGHQWNEKWIYPARGHDGAQRVVLWNRYDFLGVFRMADSGSLEPEPFGES